MTDLKLRSLCPWNKLRPKDSESDTITMNNEDTMSEEYDSGEDEKEQNPLLDLWTGLSALRRFWA
jgi:hypothetical protein